MILFRYLAKEVLSAMAAISFVLLLIILSGKFAKLLAEAAAGDIDASVLFTIIGFMSLRFLELILSLGLFIGILFAFGRLYVDSEMTVMSACGISEVQLLKYTFWFSLPVAMTVSVISFYLAPKGYQVTHQIMQEQKSRTQFETIKPARFIGLQGGKGVSYTGKVSDDKTELYNVFVALPRVEEGSEDSAIIVAQKGRTRVDESTGRKYLVLENGRRYVGTPTQLDYQMVEFKEYHHLVPERVFSLSKEKETEGYNLVQLLQDDSHEAKVSLHWRASLPVLVMITAFLALPLSRTQPRQGRYGKLLPGILIYVSYVVFLQSVSNELEDKPELPMILLWSVHMLYLSLALLLFCWPAIRRRFSRPQSVKVTA